MMRPMMRNMAIAGALMLASTAALAHGPGGGRGPGGAGCMGGGPGMGRGFGAHAAQALGLSAEQQKQVTALQTKHESEVAPVRAQLQAKRVELQALWSAASPDRKAILAKQSEMEPLREKMQAAQVDFRLAVEKLLTPEQRAQWSTMRGPGHGNGMRGQGAGGFGGPDTGCPGICPQP